MLFIYKNIIYQNLLFLFLNYIHFNLFIYFIKYKYNSNAMSKLIPIFIQ